MITRRSAILTPLLAERAARIIAPGIEFLIGERRQQGDDRNAVAIVVLDPVRIEEARIQAIMNNGDPSLPILWQGVIGEQNSNNWKNPFNEFARKKALVSLKTGKPSHLIQQDQPYMYEVGDFKYGGSEVRGNLIVAASGLRWEDDYLVSSSFAATLHSLSLSAMTEEFKRKVYFIGATETVTPP